METVGRDGNLSPVPLLLRFVRRLRDAGIPVSMVEALDAAQSLEHVDIGRRAEMKAALAATLVKDARRLEQFAALFDTFFGRVRAPLPADLGLSLSLDRPAEDGANGRSPVEGLPSEELLRAILQALRANDVEALRLLAAAAASRFGGIAPDRAQTERYYMYRIMRQLDVSHLLQRALAENRPDGLTELEARLFREAQIERVDEFRRLIAEAVRERLSSLAGLRRAGDAPTSAPIEDIDFLGASPEQLRQMRAAIRPLARKLAARMAHRLRRRRRGRLDVRRTVRRSLSSGGVPFEPTFRRPKVSKPDLCMLCDVSGSMAEFAEFSLSFLNAMNEEFPRIRSFAFIDGVDEVSDLFTTGAGVSAQQLLARHQLVWADGHSDYGHVFGAFWDNFGRSCVGPKTTVIVTGDARNNFKEEGAQAFKEMARQARRVYWLNPEPRASWNEGDSIIDRYALYCGGAHEVRNLRQLAELVYQLEA